MKIHRLLLLPASGMLLLAACGGSSSSTASTDAPTGTVARAATTVAGVLVTNPDGTPVTNPDGTPVTNPDGTPLTSVPRKETPTSLDPRSPAVAVTISPSHTVPATEWQAAVDRARNGKTIPEDLWFVLPQATVFPEYVRQAGYWDDAVFEKEKLITDSTTAYPWANGSKGAAWRSWKMTSATRNESHTLTATVLLFADPQDVSSAIAALRAQHDGALTADPMVFKEGSNTHTLQVTPGPNVAILVDIVGPNSTETVVSSTRLLASVLAGRLAADVKNP